MENDLVLHCFDYIFFGTLVSWVPVGILLFALIRFLEGFFYREWDAFAKEYEIGNPNRKYSFCGRVDVLYNEKLDEKRKAFQETFLGHFVDLNCREPTFSLWALFWPITIVIIFAIIFSWLAKKLVNQISILWTKYMWNKPYECGKEERNKLK